LNRRPNIYSLFAVLLPVALGLGLIYLSIIGRISESVALFATIGMAVTLRVLIYLRDEAHREDE
jgi:hypothetical protein